MTGNQEEQKKEQKFKFNFNANKNTNQNPSQGAPSTSQNNSTNSTNSTSKFSFGNKQQQNNSTNSTSKFSFGNKQQQENFDDLKIPESLKDRSIKNILDKMELNLETQAKAFQDQANKIAHWDRKIYDCRELILHLEVQLVNTDAAQKALQKDALNLLQQQNNFIEKMKQKTTQTTNISVPEDQRDRIYRLAQHLSNKYSDMETQLKEMVDKIEKNRHLSEVSSDMDKISKITNCHMNSLQWIANQSDDLDSKIEKLKKSLNENFSAPK